MRKKNKKFHFISDRKSLERVIYGTFSNEAEILLHTKKNRNQEESKYSKLFMRNINKKEFDFIYISIRTKNKITTNDEKRK